MAVSNIGKVEHMNYHIVTSAKYSESVKNWGCSLSMYQGKKQSSGKSTGSSSPAMSADLKASSNNGSGAHPGSGSGDANHKSAGSSITVKSWRAVVLLRRAMTE